MAALALLTAGCGSSPTGNPSGPASPAPPAPTSSEAAPSPSPSAARTTVEVGTATVGDTGKQVLTSSAGMTLYYRTSDHGSTVCSGGCAGVWPPLLLASGTPTKPAGLPGKLAVLVDANGRQVEYNGHPLYTFASDTAPGDAKGNGIAGVWFVATPQLGPAM
jgi:predicted lipoprotein with Yx(FWY)xxD motif